MGCAIFSLPLGLAMCIHMVAQHHIDIETRLGDIAKIHGIRRVAFAQHGVAMLVEGHCRKAFGQSVGNHLLSRAWEELDHLGGDGLANPIPASVNVSRGFSIDRIFSHANDSTRIFIEFGGSTLLQTKIREDVAKIHNLLARLAGCIPFSFSCAKRNRLLAS